MKKKCYVQRYLENVNFILIFYYSRKDYIREGWELTVVLVSTRNSNGSIGAYKFMILFFSLQLHFLFYTKHHGIPTISRNLE